MISAYKDLPSPIKELIDWDQQRQDVQIKYDQVIEQFNPAGMLDPALQALDAENNIDPAPLMLERVAYHDESGAVLVEDVCAGNGARRARRLGRHKQQRQGSLGWR